MSIILVKFSFDAHNSVKNFGLLKWKSYIQINNSYVNSNLWQNSCVVNIFLNRDLVFFSLSLWKIKTKMAKYIITKFLNSMGRILIPLVLSEHNVNNSLYNIHTRFHLRSFVSHEFGTTNIFFSFIKCEVVLMLYILRSFYKRNVTH